MARSHAKVFCAIWRDPAWTGLTARAQWLYTLLLSHQGLSLVGSLDLTPGKWVTLAQDISRGAVDAAVDELEAARFIVVDWDTGELLIRSFTRHDIDPNRLNVNLSKGLWGQWGAIASPALRSIALHEMTEPVWAKLAPHAPLDAERTRRSARLEPGQRVPVANRNADHGYQPPSNSLLPPTDIRPPDETSPVQADFDHPPVPKIDPDQQKTNLAHIDQLKARRNGGDAA